jgi:hypothetical protein
LRFSRCGWFGAEGRDVERAFAFGATDFLSRRGIGQAKLSFATGAGGFDGHERRGET